ncbi:MAG: stage II sporulation protein D [Bacilli bacterium]|nr:stage II sporulation protein D [Bacilli bacterium]MDD4547546.1 stage II sporulation protein D [Bacilli bacterium]
MINHHTLIDLGPNNELYLFIDFNYEFGKDFNFKNFKKKFNSFNDYILDYIKTKQINFSNGKILIVVGGVLLGTLFMNNNQITIKPPTDFNNYEIVETLDNHVEEDITEEQIIPKEISASPNIIKEEVKTPPPKKVSPPIKKVEETIKPKVEIKPQPKTEVAPKKEVVSPTPKVITEPPPVEKTIPKETSPVITQKQITLHRSNGQVISLGLEDYVIGVVAAEMPASFNIEALKAQSVVARTYALKKIDRNERLTDTTSNQVYKDNEQLKNMWGNTYDKYYSKVKQAVTSTEGEYLTYQNDYIEAVYHSTSNGKTEDSSAVWGNSFPYLKSVNSPWDLHASSYLRETSKEFSALKQITGIDFNEFTNIEILSRTNGDRVDKIKIDDTVFSGVELRMLLGLRSADFDIIFENGKVNFITRGYGHGVGMSQYGANGMALAGHSYKEILNHYYSGTTLKK